MSRARRPLSLGRAAAVLISTLAVAALVAPTVPAIAADQKAITPIRVLEGPAEDARDPLGTPSASSLVAADNLLVTGGSERAALHASADLTSVTSAGSRSAVPGLRDLNPRYATAAGRFTADGAERTLALRLSDLGEGAALTLTSPSAAIEDQTRGATLTAAPAQGDTVQISVCGAAACPAQHVVAASTNQPFLTYGSAAVAVGDPGGAGAPAAEWSVRHLGGPFQLVNSLTGLCLVREGDRAVTSPCGYFAEAGVPENQKWDFATENGRTQLRVPGSNAGQGALYLSGDGSFRIGAVGAAGSVSESSDLLPVQQSGGVVPTWVAPLVYRDAGHDSALATGDLDRRVTEGGYRDEAVVAYVGVQGFRLVIVDYNSDLGLQETVVSGLRSGTGHVIGVEVGDFDGDGKNEIALVHSEDGRSYWVQFVRYNGPGDADVIDASSAPAIETDIFQERRLSAGGITTASGDLLGTGRDALAVGYLDKFYTDANGHRSARTKVNVFSYGPRHALVGSAVYDTTLVTQDVQESWPSQGTPFHARGPRLVSALLEVGAGSPARRQLLLAVPTAAGQTCFRALAADQPAGGSLTIQQRGADVCMAPVESTSPATPGRFQPIQLAAGGFSGRAADAQKLPAWGVATLTGGTPTEPHVALLTIKDGALVSHDAGPVKGSPGSPIALTAFDQKNETLRLGAPLVVSLENIQTPTMIAAAPPAHMDWIYDASAGKDAFVNISAKPELALAMSDSESKTFSSTTETMLGGSATVSAKVSASDTVGFDVGVAKGKASTEFHGSASATLGGAGTSGSEHSSSKTTTVRSRTVSDDVVRVKVASQRIYRYPVIGGNAVTNDPADCGGACHAYYDVYVPTSDAFVQTDAGGRTLESYAPPWVNGNLLSYPTERIEQPGEWSYLDDNGTTVTKSEDILTQGFLLDGASSNTTLQLTTIDNSTHKSEVNGTFKQGVGFKQSAKGSISVGVAEEGAAESSEASLDLSESFSHTSTGKTSTTSTAGFELLAPAVAHGGYGFTTYYYYLGGVSKVNYSVQPLAVDATWWNTNYGSAPDPALALPFAVELEDGKTPQFSTELRRQQIRGFRALQVTDGVATQNLPEFTSTPRVGDKVRFAVDVHNYSLATSADTKVEFFAVPVKPGTLLPVGPSQPIGEAVTVNPLAAQDSTVAYSPEWTAAMPSVADPTSTWNIFVVLNRENRTPEIHPYNPETGQEEHNRACPTTRSNNNFARASVGTVDAEGFRVDPMTGKRDVSACGQNNQGYGTVAVLPAKPTMRAAAEAEPEAPANVQLAGAGFATLDETAAALTEASPVPTVTEGIATQSFVTVGTDRDSDEHQLVMVWDGNPDKGGQLIASTTLQGASSETGGYARFSWTPAGVGEHQLYQKVFGSSDAGSSDAQIVTVNVVAQAVEPGEESPAPTIPPSGGGADVSDPSAAPAANRRSGNLSSTGGSIPIFALVFAAAALVVGALLVGSRARSRQ